MLDGFVLLSVGLNLSGADWTPAGLWLAVVASGLYHGVNPGMGWPLAVSAALMERSSRALLAALWPISVGHLLAMLLVILPFALLIALVEWQRQIQIGASLLVIGFGIFRLVNRRHPRALARIRPTQLGLWSFAVAIAHGAGLMLVPVYLGLCRAADLDKGHAAAGALINANLGMAVLVSVVHSGAMIAAGGLLAWLVYRYLGLKFVSRSWFNLDAIWAVSLILVGAVSLAIGLASRHLDTSRTMQSEQCWSDVAAMHNVNVINFSLGSIASPQVRLLSECSERSAETRRQLRRRGPDQVLPVIRIRHAFWKIPVQPRLRAASHAGTCSPRSTSGCHRSLGSRRRGCRSGANRYRCGSSGSDGAQSVAYGGVGHVGLAEGPENSGFALSELREV